MTPDDGKLRDVLTDAQRETCARFGVDPVPTPDDLKVGLARAGSGPIHGLRHPPQGDTAGWYIWCGELSDAEDFFSPLHASHLSDELPEVVPFLALPPGWRFLLSPGHEDVWYDETLLEVASDD
jgi:hypothetical protein